MRIIVLVAFLALTACGQPTAPLDEPPPQDWSRLPQALADASLTSDGLGPIRIGGPVTTVQDAFPNRFEEGEAYEASPDCREYGLFASPPGQVALLAYDGVVHRISLYDTLLRTDRGVGIGSSAAEVIAAYPDAERQSAEYTPAPGHELFVWTDREDHIGLRFEIGENERVTAIHAGSDLNNIEGCATI
jgi:hypothetical protein